MHELYTTNPFLPAVRYQLNHVKVPYFVVEDGDRLYCCFCVRDERTLGRVPVPGVGHISFIHMQGNQDSGVQILQVERYLLF